MHMHVYQPRDLETGLAPAAEASFARLLAVLHTQLWNGSHSKGENKAYVRERDTGARR